jgi:hypothetical protein
MPGVQPAVNDSFSASPPDLDTVGKLPIMRQQVGPLSVCGNTVREITKNWTMAVGE